MEVQITILNDELYPEGGRSRDLIIRALDRAMGGATWEANGEGWVARR